MNHDFGNCVMCNSDQMRKVRTTDETLVDGTSFSYGIDAWACKKCDEMYFSGPDLVHIERDIAKRLLLSRAYGPQAFRRLRSHAVGVESQVFAAAIGTTPETVSRWENGRMPINGAAFEVVRLLAAKALGIEYTTPMVRQTVRVRLEPARKPTKANTKAPRAAAGAKPAPKRARAKAPAAR